MRISKTLAVLDHGACVDGLTTHQLPLLTVLVLDEFGLALLQTLALLVFLITLLIIRILFDAGLSFSAWSLWIFLILFCLCLRELHLALLKHTHAPVVVLPMDIFWLKVTFLLGGSTISSVLEIAIELK